VICRTGFVLLSNINQWQQITFLVDSLVAVTFLYVKPASTLICTRLCESTIFGFVYRRTYQMLIITLGLHYEDIFWYNSVIMCCSYWAPNNLVICTATNYHGRNCHCVHQYLPNLVLWWAVISVHARANSAKLYSFWAYPSKIWLLGLTVLVSSASIYPAS